MPHTVERRALLKLLLHAIKYPAYGVNGVLVGTISSGHVTAVDAVPFVHNFITLAPAFETALCQLDAHLKASAGSLRVVGYYQANEYSKDNQLSGSGKLLATKIANLYPGSIAVVLDTQGLKECMAHDGRDATTASPGAGSPLLQWYGNEGRGAWALGPAEGIAVHLEGLVPQLEQLSAEGAHRKLADFEDHLEDVTLDWLNPKLVRAQ